jgi:hypothetical protein
MNSWIKKEVDRLAPNSDRSDIDDDLNWLYPNYVKAFKSFTCPSTRNFIRSAPGDWSTYTPQAGYPPGPNSGQYLNDLANNSINKESNGDSYELFGNLSGGRGKKSEKNVGAFEIKYYAAALGARPGPAAIFLIMDADDPKDDGTSTPSNAVNNWPEEGNNHGAAGTQANFCDGHAEWIPRKKFAHIWNLGQDPNPSFVPPP